MIDTMHTIAEIGVAVVALVAIVAALDDRSEDSAINQIAIQNVLVQPIVVVMFALLPSVLSRLPVKEEMILAFSLSLFAITHLYIVYWVFRRFRPLFGPEINTALIYITCLIATILSLIQLGSVILGFASYYTFLYAFGLYYLLGMSFTNFVMYAFGSNRWKAGA